MKLVLSTGIFDHIGIDKLPGLLPRIKKAGFRYLEVVDRLEFDECGNILDELRKKAKDCGIEIPGWHLAQFSPFHEKKVSGAAAVDYMKRSIEKGARIGARNHVLHWFYRFTDKSYDARWRDIVGEWVDQARIFGVRLLMETVPYKPSNQRYVMASEIIDFVRNYPPEVMSVCVDVNHSNLKEKLPKVIHCVEDRLVSLHLSDNDGYEEKHWLPGQGVIDFPSLFASLEAVNFDGMLVMEVNKWCERPHDPAAIRKLYEFGMSLLDTRRPHPDTPELAI